MLWTGGLDLSDTVRDGARVVMLDERLRNQVILALTEDNRLHIEVCPCTDGSPCMQLRCLCWSLSILPSGPWLGCADLWRHVAQLGIVRASGRL